MNDETMRRAITAIAEGLGKAGADLSTIADTGDLVNELGENLLRIAGEVEDIETTAALQDAFNSPTVPDHLTRVERELETVIGERDALIAECSAALEGREAVRESLVDTLGEVDDALETAATWAIKYGDSLLERKRLEAIVDRLPKTADGVPVKHGDKVWHPSHQDAFDYSNVTFSAWGEGGPDPIGECYSTREAAAASAEGGE